MTFGDFNSAFQNQLASPLAAPSAHDIATEIVRRDQQRTHWLAGVCLLFWILGAAGMALLVTGLNQFMMEVRLNNAFTYIELKDQTNPAIDGQSKDGGSTRTLQGYEDDSREQKLDKARQIIDGTQLLHHSLPLIDGSLVALFLAALCTVWLVFASRRTTLNRINISLAQISEQLRQLGKTPSVESK